MSIFVFIRSITVAYSICECRDNDVRHVTLKECQLLVKYFDLDNDGALKYSE